jgi:hypothetical protein
VLVGRSVDVSLWIDSRKTTHSPSKELVFEVLPVVLRMDVNGFVNETRRNGRDRARRGAMGGTGHS